ncbi:Sec-independent protein translocase protein TatB [Aurantiacibacter gangjinensis]|uniref:Sec-independent protein translocase protein TatB n=1 Tax=Aurantiacibacter gangjinensis TaxID=502682 RepID=UPI00090A9944|nr:Sec-independent protein translocase protein TatB [Aurantiacibacter gangjinensis]APE27052.1 Twin-arginine translocation protein TatB [Aurantiacibacter gangjinensis]
MFDIGATELLLIAIVAILVIGPKDMPLAFRTAGRWIGKVRRMSGQFRAGLDNIVREAEMDDMEKKWKAQNEKIMRENPDAEVREMTPADMMPPDKRAEHERIVAEKNAIAEKERLAAETVAVENEGAGVKAEAAVPKPVAVEPIDPDPVSAKPAAAEPVPVEQAAPDDEPDLFGDSAPAKRGD